VTPPGSVFASIVGLRSKGPWGKAGRLYDWSFSRELDALLSNPDISWKGFFKFPASTQGRSCLWRCTHDMQDWYHSRPAEIHLSLVGIGSTMIADTNETETNHGVSIMQKWNIGAQVDIYLYQIALHSVIERLHLGRSGLTC
jgi:hypothetical protein